MTTGLCTLPVGPVCILYVTGSLKLSGLENSVIIVLDVFFFCNVS
jgi:hypothetical protein